MMACCPVCGTRLEYESFPFEGITYGYAVCPTDAEHCGGDPDCGNHVCEETTEP